MPLLRARLIAQRPASLGIAQPDTDNAPLTWLPRAEVQILERHEHLNQTIIHLQAPTWLIEQKHLQPLTYDPAQETGTLDLGL